MRDPQYKNASVLQLQCHSIWLRSCKLARKMESIAGPVLKQKTAANVPVCEQEPANVAFETISAGAFEMKAYFPVSSSDKTVVFMHLPGGKIAMRYFQ